MNDFDYSNLVDLYQVDEQRLELARRRQSAVWNGEKPDAWPIVVGDQLTNRQEAIPAPKLGEAFHDPRLMLCHQLRPACQMANSGSDGVPSIRANTGTATLLACLGLEQEILEDQMPRLEHHLSLKEAAELNPDDIEFKGAFTRALDYIKVFREIMGNKIDIYCSDTQGPFDLAHLLIGDEIYYVLYDDPQLLHHIMNLCTELYIRCTEALKEAIGENPRQMVHGNALYSPAAGVRICEDTTTIVGGASINEFTLPYTLRAASRFGGAWVHFCGRCDELSEILCRQPEIKGLNYGIIPGKEEDFDFDREMTKMAEHGKVYFGSIPRRFGENGQDYLRRLYDYASHGCLIADGHPAKGNDNGFNTTRELLDFWYSLM